MLTASKVTLLFLFTSLFCAVEGRADIYKCKDANGDVMYSQTPCKKQKSKKIGNTASEKPEPKDCSFASRFAVTTARYMRAGSRSDEIFNRYGGLDALSKGSIGVINYVYSFRTNADVTEERIGGLAQAKCRAGSFGEVSCEALPRSFTEGLGGCDANDLVETQEPPTTIPDATEEPTGYRAAPTAGDPRSGELTQQCKKRNRDQIDAIDAEMRRGYSSAQGEAYRERLRVLTQRLRNC
ncbi:MAG: DUF4124 domain-containing protein [Gammaproteobacteria bacterium]|nr:DUF4124 domain-containing protein [Gammaproteobacteria bacterium]MDH3415224.1 DUF4124 domain-containing protein [Gammaproteobacteria bacterium]